MNTRLVLWIVLMIAASAVATGVVLGSWEPSNDLELFIVMVFFMGNPLGSFWMMYQTFRYERNPLGYILLALFVPLSFLWYYVERVRPAKKRRPIRKLG